MVCYRNPSRETASTEKESGPEAGVRVFMRLLRGGRTPKSIPMPRISSGQVLDGKRVFVDVIKDLKIRRLSWIIQVRPKCNHRCAYKKEADNMLLALKMEERAVSQGMQEK